MPTAGVPESVPSENETPGGRAPSSAMTGAGLPIAVGVKEPTVPITNAAAAEDVKEGAWSMISVIA